MARKDPLVSNEDFATFVCMFPMAQAKGYDEGDKLFASPLLFPAAMGKKTSVSTRASTATKSMPGVHVRAARCIRHPTSLVAKIRDWGWL
jgi:hypothetical protein